jgi:hypothetical protein
MADVAILDLEDAVAPKDKAEARTTALNYLAGNPSDGALHALRINGLDTLSGFSASKGGKSIIAATSTAAHGKISRIVPRLQGPVTTPRIDTHYVVTEFGSANLKGLSSTERAHALIGLAHPEFRDELLASAKKLHLV